MNQLKAIVVMLMLAVAQASAAERANLYLYRKPNFIPYGLATIQLELDGRPLAKFAPASYVFRQVEPGMRFLVTGAATMPIKVLRLEVGRTYFFKTDFSGSKWDEVSEQVGRADISKLKRVNTLY
jgi:hypothetical protein